MVAEFNKDAYHNGQAYVGNLVSEEEKPSAFESPEFYDFDLATIGLGFHHFSDPTRAASRLAARLKPGGIFMIIDNVSNENGFSRESAEELFCKAGVGRDFQFSIIEKELRIGRGPAAWSQKVFIARGSKA